MKFLFRGKGRYLFLFLLIISINFFLPRLMKADPFLFLSSDEGEEIFSYDEDQINKYRIYYGLDKPLYIQYLYYMKGVFSGNLGFSISKSRSVFAIISDHLPWTLSIVVISIFVSAFIGIILGSILAWYNNNYFSKILYILIVSISQIPAFLIGFGILVLAAIYIKIIPLSGGITPFREIQLNFISIKDLALHAILPVTTLSIARFPHFCILIRGSMLHEIDRDYILTAKAKGLKDYLILWKHCLRNAIDPLLTSILMSFILMFNGALVIENIFQYPGIGKLIREAVFLRDYPLIQGIFLCIAVLTLLVSLLSEIFREYLEFRGVK